MSIETHRPSNLSLILAIIGACLNHVFVLIPNLPSYGLQILIFISHVFFTISLIVSRKAQVDDDKEEPFMDNICPNPPQTPAVLQIPQTLYGEASDLQQIDVITQPSSVLNNQNK